MTDADQRLLIRIGHSPDPDDTYMWWPLCGLDGQDPPIASDRFRFETVVDDLEVLNHRSETAGPDDLLECTSISCAQYSRVRDRYVITACGANIGEGYGPKLISAGEMSLEQLRQMDPVIAVPGEKTTAFLVLNMMLGPGSFRHEVLPSDRIIPSLIDKTHQVGLVIHEAQLSYQDEGLHMIEDLGSWWHRHTGHPLPLGLNVVRSDLDQIHGDGTIAELTKLLHESVSHAIAHHEESLGYTMNFARDMGIELAGRFVDLYINHRTLDFGAEGVAAIEELTRRGVQMGLLQQQEPVEVVWHR